LLTTLGLTAEGYLLAFQLFIVHTICYFCLGVFFLIFAISLVLLFSKKMPFFQYSYLFTIFFMVYMIRIPYVNLSQDNNYLFYSPTCPHCHQTIAYLKQHKIHIKLMNANHYKSFLNIFGINQVPCLIAKNKAGNINIIVGEYRIEKYLVNNKSCVYHYNDASMSEASRKFNRSMYIIKKDLKKLNEMIKSQKQKTLSNKNNSGGELNNSTINDFYNSTKNYGMQPNNSPQACTIGNEHCN